LGRQPYITGYPGQAGSILSARYADVTSEPDRFHKLRHDLSNPLSALLAETQLLLLNESKLDPETLTSLREIEALAVRMRGILREN
jgi:signal transduction histidine kinase